MGQLGSAEDARDGRTIDELARSLDVFAVQTAAAGHRPALTHVTSGLSMRWRSDETKPKAQEYRGSGEHTAGRVL